MSHWWAPLAHSLRRAVPVDAPRSAPVHLSRTSHRAEVRAIASVHEPRSSRVSASATRESPGAATGGPALAHGWDRHGRGPQPPRRPPGLSSRSATALFVSEKSGSGPHPAGLLGRPSRSLARGGTRASNVASGGVLPVDALQFKGLAESSQRTSSASPLNPVRRTSSAQGFGHDGMPARTNIIETNDRDIRVVSRGFHNASRGAETPFLVQLAAPKDAMYHEVLQWSQPGSNRRPPACKADRVVHSCLVVSRKCLQMPHFCWPREDTKGRRETNWCPPGAPSAFVTWGGGKRAAPLARLRQLEDAAAAKAALASAITVCASRRGISSNSSITWPYVLRVSRASWPSWRAT